MSATAPRALRISIASRALTGEMMSRLVSVRVAARLNQPAQCEIAFATGPGGSDDLALAPLGAALSVRQVGRESNALFEGEITAIEIDCGTDGATVLRVRGYDLLHRLRKRQELRLFESVTPADLAGRLASPIGMTVRAQEPGPRIERLLQHSHSDFDLLVEVCNRAGLHLVADGDRLHLVTLAGHGVPIPLRLGTSVWQLRAEANGDSAAVEVAALGWHPQQASTIDQNASPARSGRRVPLRVAAADVGAAGTRTAVNQPGRSDDEVAALAQARRDIREATLITVDGVAEGDPALRPGTRIALAGVAGPFTGEYVLTEVIHTIDAGGHLTRFSTAPPRPVASAPLPAVLTLGRVTDIRDPQGLGRIRVSMPAYGDLDAGWLAAVFPGAGPGRGIVALPNPDDTVLVALPHGDLASGMVLGSVYGGTPPPDPGVDGGTATRWSLTMANGQSIVIDDGGRRIRLETAVGSFVELGPAAMTMHAATDLIIEAPGRAMTIRANTVEFQRAPGGK